MGGLASAAQAGRLRKDAKTARRRAWSGIRSGGYFTSSLYYRRVPSVNRYRRGALTLLPSR